MTKGLYFTGFEMMKRWMENRNAGKILAKYFIDHNYKRVAIYGAGDLGKLLYAELRDYEIEIVYFVDINSESLSDINGIPVILFEEINSYDSVDAFIITLLGNFDEICGYLMHVAPEVAAISLGTAVYEL